MELEIEVEVDGEVEDGVEVGVGVDVGVGVELGVGVDEAVFGTECGLLLSDSGELLFVGGSHIRAIGSITPESCFGPPVHRYALTLKQPKSVGSIVSETNSVDNGGTIEGLAGITEGSGGFTLVFFADVVKEVVVVDGSAGVAFSVEQVLFDKSNRDKFVFCFL